MKVESTRPTRWTMEVPPMEIMWENDPPAPGFYVMTDAKLNIWSGPHWDLSELLLRSIRLERKT
jgi:hypothetical protein